MQYVAYPSDPKFDLRALILMLFLRLASCEKYSALFLRGLAMGGVGYWAGIEFLLRKFLIAVSVNR